MTNLKIYAPDEASDSGLRFVGNQIPAGFPSPAADYMENILDLNKAVVKNPESTFYARVCGHSMKDANLSDGDIIVIDKSLEYHNNAIAVCYIDGEFTIKRIKKINGQMYLMPANKDFNPIPVPDEADFICWGIVTYILKKAI